MFKIRCTFVLNESTVDKQSPAAFSSARKSARRCPRPLPVAVTLPEMAVTCSQDGWAIQHALVAGVLLIRREFQKAEIRLVTQEMK